MIHLRRFQTLPAIGILTLIYFFAGKLGLSLAFLHASASPVWPPAGIAIAALLVFGYRTWPAIFLGAFLVNITTFGNLATSLGIATGNTLEGLCGAWLVNRLAGGSAAFDRSQDVFKFSAAAMVSTVVSPTIGVTSLALAGFADWSKYGAIWSTWWLGDVTGVLIVAPVAILWCVASTRQWTRADVIEVCCLLFLLLVLGEIVFGGWFPISARNYPIAFICGPIVVWTAFRFTQRETATSIFILSAIAIWGTLHNYGPFVMETDNQSLLLLQISTAVLTITAMALAAGMAERKRAETAVAQQKGEIEAANRTKDNFLAMLSHELRTPLTPVVAALEVLEMEPARSKDSAATLKMMRRNIELESQLIDDLLDLTRITRGKFQLQLDRFDAHEAVRNAFEICCRSEAACKNITVRLDLIAEAHHIEADPARFQQIIWNLLKNAIKFTNENGAITISSSNSSPGALTLSVQDTGIGIDPELMGRIFDPFEQGNRAAQRQYGGLGLGLAISKLLAHAHGATLAAASEGKGRGATFSLTIETVAARESVPEQPKANAQPPPRALRILLVDDHRDTCAAFDRLLTLRGHNVVATNDVQSALKATEQNHFDMLISDVGLPDGTGSELMKRLRMSSNIRGIAISGFGMNGDIQRSLEAGFSEHLVKPIKLENLEAAIERVMQAQPART